MMMIVIRSGTTLMRAMLDAHPDVRCGEETRVVPRLLQMRSHWKKSQKESMRLEEAGLTDDVLASAISSFILEVVARHGEPAPRLCNKVAHPSSSPSHYLPFSAPGPFHPQVRAVPQGTVSQQQVPVHGQRWQGNCALHHQ